MAQLIPFCESYWRIPYRVAFLKWLFLPTIAICLQATLQPNSTYNSDLHTREKCAPYNQLGSGCWQLLRETGHKEAAE